MVQHYLILALRTLRANRSHTILNVVGLAVGLAGGLLIFLFLKHHLSTDRYHAHADRLFRVTTDMHLDDGSVEPYPEAPQPLAEALRRDYPQVEQAGFLMGVREMTVGVEPGRDRPGHDGPGNGTPSRRFKEHAGVGFVEPQWLDVLTYRWLLGDAKTALSQPGQVVLSESWANRYFGDVNPLGRRLLLDNKTLVTVAGVVAEPPAPTDTYLGLLISMATLKQHDPTVDQTNWWQLTSLNRLYVRLRDAGDATAVNRTFPALARQRYPSAPNVFHFGLQPLRDVHFDTARLNDQRPVQPSLLWSLGLIGVLLILTACINFINLATAQALRRSREVGVRKVLGSSRRQLAGQFLLETGLIVLMAAAAAGLLVLGTLSTFRDWTQLPLAFRPDAPTVLFICTLLLGVVGLAGAYPAFLLSGRAPGRALRGVLTGRATGRFTVRRVLIVGQFVVGIALLIGALVVARQVRYLQAVDLGYRRDQVVMVKLPDKVSTTRAVFRQRLVQLPGIQSISFEHRSPVNELNYGGQIKFNGKTTWEPYAVRERLADANYVATYGLRLLAGRNLMPADSIREYLINETLMRRLGYQHPKQIIGKKLQYHLSAVPAPIVGVVRDFHQKSLREHIEPCLIASYPNMYAQAGIRLTGANPTQTVQRMQTVWQALYPGEVFESEWLDAQIAQTYRAETLVGRLVNVFTALALLICCLGLYGLVAQSVVQRTKEIGIRKVLGASVGSIVALFSKDYLRLVLIALLIAAPLAGWAMQQWLDQFAYKIGLPWWTFAAAGTFAVLLALLTVASQSIRAALANPVTSLRAE